VRTVPVELVAVVRERPYTVSVRPVGIGIRPTYVVRGTDVHALDWRYASVASAPAPPGELLTAVPDLSLIVSRDGTDLVIRRDGRDVRLPVAPVDSATPLSDGTVLVTAPEMVVSEYEGRTYTSRGAHRVLLIGVDGTVRDEITLEVADAGVTALPHPYDGSVLLDAGEGQDGSEIFRVRVVDGRLDAVSILGDAIAADFSPSGDRLLVTPHPSFTDEGVRVLSWPDLEPIAAIDDGILADADADADADDTDDDDDGDDGDDDYFGDDSAPGFDLYGCFLTDDLIVLGVYESAPLLCRGDLTPIGRVALPPPYDEATPTSLSGRAADAFDLDLYLGRDDSVATVWRITP
jgi:hypothetical protein